MNEKLLQEAFISLWKSEGVLIAVNHHHPDAILPSYLKDRENVVLDYDPFAIVPITDLVTDSEGIRATLSFDRIPCKTFVPWEAVLGIQPRLSQNQAPSQAPKPKRHLSLVK